MLFYISIKIYRNKIERRKGLIERLIKWTLRGGGGEGEEVNRNRENEIKISSILPEPTSNILLFLLFQTETITWNNERSHKIPRKISALFRSIFSDQQLYNNSTQLSLMQFKYFDEIFPLVMIHTNNQAE